ncbi:unnamed protein product [Amoebophrya sp. A25]|nr:unnamed protein product [Amoebophrya sp. A25]|eukprot:GSA25T00013951001.1
MDNSSASHDPPSFSTSKASKRQRLPALGRKTGGPQSEADRLAALESLWRKQGEKRAQIERTWRQSCSIALLTDELLLEAVEGLERRCATELLVAEQTMTRGKEDGVKTKAEVAAAKEDHEMGSAVGEGNREGADYFTGERDPGHTSLLSPSRQSAKTTKRAGSAHETADPALHDPSRRLENGTADEPAAKKRKSDKKTSAHASSSSHATTSSSSPSPIDVLAKHGPPSSYAATLRGHQNELLLVQTRGKLQKQGQILFPEDALYLAERGSLVVFRLLSHNQKKQGFEDERPQKLSLDQVYKLAADAIGLDAYVAYARLRRAGYTVTRDLPEINPDLPGKNKDKNNMAMDQASAIAAKKSDASTSLDPKQVAGKEDTSTGDGKIVNIKSERPPTAAAFSAMISQKVRDTLLSWAIEASPDMNDTTHAEKARKDATTIANACDSTTVRKEIWLPVSKQAPGAETKAKEPARPGVEGVYPQKPTTEHKEVNIEVPSSSSSCLHWRVSSAREAVKPLIIVDGHSDFGGLPDEECCVALSSHADVNTLELVPFDFS